MKCLVFPITNIHKHPNNPKLYVANAGEYQIITGSEPDGSCHYHEGQLGFFLPEGAIVPEKLAIEMYVKGTLAGKQRNVVKSKERNGVRSDGLFYGSQGESWNPNWKPGDDVTNEVGITFTETAGIVDEVTKGLDKLTKVLESGEPLEKHFVISKIKMLPDGSVEKVRTHPKDFKE